MVTSQTEILRQREVRMIDVLQSFFELLSEAIFRYSVKLSSP